MWTKAGNFKGNNARSIKETASFIRLIQKERIGGHFIFLNLMETHLPYAPHADFVKKFVPYFYETPESQQFMREFNRKAMQWLIPLVEPFSPIESATLSDMYDAEVAYHDHLLAELISVLDSVYHRENSLVIFLADHGEMLGEHGYIGHGFGVHEELIRVPLFMRIPGLDEGKRIDHRVSLTRVFHTVLDFMGFESISMPYAQDVDVSCQSLLNSTDREGCSSKYLISEAYSPDNAIQIMQRHYPDLINKYHANITQRAVYHGK
jgi:arylsulfatase A-like enzyme